MSNPLVRDLETLIAQFHAGGWRELRIVADGVSLLLSTDPTTEGLGADRGPAAQTVPARVSLPPVPERKESAASSAPPAPAGAVDPSWHAVDAPNLGTFYRSPKPGSPPFVQVGDRVTPETEICLLEVMKLFTSVKAGVAGTVAAIIATDAELVEGGQTLFYISLE